MSLPNILLNVPAAASSTSTTTPACSAPGASCSPASINSSKPPGWNSAPDPTCSPQWLLFDWKAEKGPHNLLKIRIDYGSLGSSFDSQKRLPWVHLTSTSLGVVALAPGRDLDCKSIFPTTTANTSSSQTTTTNTISSRIDTCTFSPASAMLVKDAVAMKLTWPNLTPLDPKTIIEIAGDQKPAEGTAAPPAPAGFCMMNVQNVYLEGTPSPRAPTQEEAMGKGLSVAIIGVLAGLGGLILMVGLVVAVGRWRNKERVEGLRRRSVIQSKVYAAEERHDVEV
ncbi:hypothetical protein HDV05_003950 [Chytridiales sp. JEL 0842]|nr:hypothetical protein HDV05_003950 [Chytridiales sp. JEL 0842]